MPAVVFGRFLGVLILVPGRYLKAFYSWILVPGVRVLGVASPGHCWSWSLLLRSSGPGGFRLTRFLRVVASELLLASCSWRAVAGWLF